jgi:neutral ceramidase
MGYANRDHASVAVHDDLVATALVLSDGEVRLAIVTCDLIFVHPLMAARIRALAAGRTGIPAENVMICCSHTHSGPVTYVPRKEDAGADPDAWEMERSYLDNLAYLVAGAITEAHAGLQPAAWGVGRGEVTIGVNRRQALANGRIVLGENPQGDIDPKLLVWRVDGIPEGDDLSRSRPLATIANYACHAVCLSSNSYVISADWPGVMRRAVEPATGAMAGFVQGTGADVNPIGGPQDTFDCAQRAGDLAAGALLDLYPRIPLRRDARLAAAYRVCWLPLLGPVDGQGRRVPPFDEVAARVTGLPRDEVGAFLARRFPWAADVVAVEEGTRARGERGSGPEEPRPGAAGWYVQAEVQVMRLGDAVLVGIAAEPFVAIGRAIKARSTAAHTLVAGYSNGSIGYLPPPEAYEQGGYEVNTSYVYYRLPAPLAPASAALVMDAALELIDATSGS